VVVIPGRRCAANRESRTPFRTQHSLNSGFARRKTRAPE
jgi:hypothetical protein